MMAGRDLKDVLLEWSDKKVKLREVMRSIKLEALRVHRDDPNPVNLSCGS